MHHNDIRIEAEVSLQLVCPAKGWAIANPGSLRRHRFVAHLTHNLRQPMQLRTSEHEVDCRSQAGLHLQFDLRTKEELMQQLVSAHDNTNDDAHDDTSKK
jgi:hypothetical protein